MINSLPPAFQQLPGVNEGPTGTLRVGGPQQAGPAAAANGPQAMVYEGSGASRQASYRNETRQREFAVDLKNNPQLADTLKQAGMPTDPRGLASVAGRASRCAPEFRNLVNSAVDVHVSLGKNPGAISRYQSAFTAFSSASNMPANETGDLTYMLMRISMNSVTQDQKGVRQAITQQANRNLKLLDALQQYQKGLKAKLNAAYASGSNKIPVVESDFHLNSAGKVERVADANPSGQSKGDVAPMAPVGQPGMDPATKAGGGGVMMTPFGVAATTGAQQPGVTKAGGAAPIVMSPSATTANGTQGPTKADGAAGAPLVTPFAVVGGGQATKAGDASAPFAVAQTQGGQTVKVDGPGDVPISTTRPPQLRVMTRAELENEIQETAQQIKNLKAANNQLNTQNNNPNGPQVSTMAPWLATAIQSNVVKGG